jgi:hypothetical protein
MRVKKNLKKIYKKAKVNALTFNNIDYKNNYIEFTLKCKIKGNATALGAAMDDIDQVNIKVFVLDLDATLASNKDEVKAYA